MADSSWTAKLATLLLVCGAMFLLAVLVVVLVVRRWLRRAEYKDLP